MKPGAGGRGPGGEDAGGQRCSLVPHDESPEAAAAPGGSRARPSRLFPSRSGPPPRGAASPPALPALAPLPSRYSSVGLPLPPVPCRSPLAGLRWGAPPPRPRGVVRSRCHGGGVGRAGRREGAWPPWPGFRRGYRGCGRSISVGTGNRVVPVVGRDAPSHAGLGLRLAGRAAPGLRRQRDGGTPAENGLALKPLPRAPTPLPPNTARVI